MSIVLIRKMLNKPFVKFLLTGGLNTAFGYFAFVFFTYLTGNAYLAVPLSTIAGVLFNFKTYGSFVFNSKNNSRVYRFCAVYAFIIIIQMLSLKGLEILGVINPYLAVAIMILPMSALSFVMMQKFVFPFSPALQASGEDNTAKKS